MKKITPETNANRAFSEVDNVCRDTRLLERLEAYPYNIKSHMMRCGLLSFEAVWDRVENFLEKHDFNRNLAKRVDAVVRNSLRKLMMGEVSYEHEEYRCYSSNAIALASAFGIHPNILFGSLDSSKPLPPYEDKELMFHEDDLETSIGETDVRESLSGDLSFEDDGYDSSMDIPNEEYENIPVEVYEDAMPVMQEDVICTRDLQLKVRGLLRDMDMMEERLLRIYFAFDRDDGTQRTLKEVGEITGFSKSRLSTSVDEAKRNLRIMARKSQLRLP